MGTATTTVINFLIFDEENRKFLIQKRSPDRLLFPNRWEIPGGHLESQESVPDCIRRELSEELSMNLTGIVGMVHEFFWDSSPTTKDQVYIITAEGQPVLEHGKATEYRWIDKNEAHLLLKPDGKISAPYEAIIKAFNLFDYFRPSSTKLRTAKLLTL